MGLGTTAATGLGRVDTAAVGAGSGTLRLLGVHRDPGVGSLFPAVGILGIRNLDPVTGPIGSDHHWTPSAWQVASGPP
jgi:hypothetical protein